jgi:hypothetical protein
VKRHGVRAGLALSVVTIIAGVAAVAVSARPTATASSVTRASSCGNLRYKPSQYVIACGDAGLIATNLTWSRWTQKSADATGTGVEKTCDPDCASGGFESAPIVLHLNKPRKCDKGGRIFSKGHWAWAGTPPPKTSHFAGPAGGYCRLSG